MLPENMHILLIEDNPGDARLLHELLVDSALPQITLEHTERLSAGLAALDPGRIDLVLLDLTLPDSCGIDTFWRLHNHAPDTPIVVLTGLQDNAVGLQLVEMGAQDYLIKGQVNTEGLLRSIRYAYERNQVIQTLRHTEALLQAERASLAHQVEERTVALQTANYELEQALRLKDEFLASLSHELRTPFGAILGITEALIEEIYGPLLEQQAKALQQVSESGRHLLGLINEMLDLTKIMAQKIQLTCEPVNLSFICQASLDMIASAAQKKHQRVVGAPLLSDVQIYGDSYRLGQVITHLLNNAVKFTLPGGTIGLELINDPQAGTVYCTIWDTGIGIAEEDFPKLFRPFVQLDGRLNRRYEGAGLGLAVAAGLVRLHGGTISATSEVGRGSRFTVMLPCQASSTLVASDGSNQTVNTSSRHSISSWSGHHVTIPAGGTNL